MVLLLKMELSEEKKKKLSIRQLIELKNVINRILNNRYSSSYKEYIHIKEVTVNFLKLNYTSDKEISTLVSQIEQTKISKEIKVKSIEYIFIILLIIIFPLSIFYFIYLANKKQKKDLLKLSNVFGYVDSILFLIKNKE